jgi:WD40 repeat protein
MNIKRTAGVSLAILLSISSLCFVAVRGQDTLTNSPAPQKAPNTKLREQERESQEWQFQRPTLVWQNIEKWPVNAVSFSPDGQMLASGREHGEVQSPKEHAVKLWNVQTGKLLRTFVAPNTSVNALQFSPDGKLLAGGGSGRTLLLWDVATGKIDKKLAGHTDWVKTIVFSPDGETLASGGVDNTIRLWDVPTGKLKRILTVSDRKKQSSLDHYSVHGVAFSPDGHTLAGAYFYNGTLRLWDVATGKLLRTLPQVNQKFGPSMTSVSFSPDGKTVVCGTGMSVLSDGGQDEKYGSAVLWDVNSGKKLRVFQSHQFYVNALAYSPSGSTLVTGGDEGTVQLHDLRTKQARHILRGRADKGNGDWRKEIRAVAFSPDGKHIAGGDVRGFIKVWRIITD